MTLYLFLLHQLGVPLLALRCGESFLVALVPRLLLLYLRRLREVSAQAARHRSLEKGRDTENDALRAAVATVE